MPRQIIIEIKDDGKSIILRKDETASVFERSAILGGIIQTPDVPVIPPGKPLSNNNNKNESKHNAKRNPSRKSGKQ